ncbi:MAG: hypothetical protein ACRED0_12745 [Gammaproteobacteria bacterium]
MAYQRLTLNLSHYPHVLAFIRGPLETLYFNDVHNMLRLPLKEQGLTAGCNFAMAHVLLAAVSGLSTTLYQPSRKKRGTYEYAFVGALVDLYPWDLEPNAPINKKERREGAKALYDEFRGPLTHRLGLWTNQRRSAHGASLGYALKIKRLTQPNGNGLSEDMIVTLETSSAWPFAAMKGSLQVRSDAKVLKLERFYWGIRQMVTRLASSFSTPHRAM